MKRWTLLVLALAMAGCSARSHYDPWFAADKYLHFATAGGIALGATHHMRASSDLSPAQARQRGLMVTLTLGVGKEVYDSEIRGGAFSWKDMTWNLLGGVCGAYLGSVLD